MYLEPAIGLFAGHMDLLPEPVQDDVGLPPLLPQGLICQCPHGRMAVPVCGHIGVTGGIAGTDIDLLAGSGVFMYHRRGPEERLGAAVGALDVDVFH